MNDALWLSGKLLADTLDNLNTRIIFAESCTAGLASATLSRVPGVSEWHCGSAVTYRNDTKHQWLRVPMTLLEPPGPGPVSEPVARAMAAGALQMTPEAHVAAAITGHLGPAAEPGLDGVLWMALARRNPGSDQPEILATLREVLPAEAQPGFTIRETRQQLAAQHLLDFARTRLNSAP